MTAGLARGGVVGKVQTPWVSASYYETFDPRPAGVIAGTFGPEQKVKAAALEAPGDPGRFVLRGIAFQVEDQPGFNSAGGKGKLWGGFGKYVLSPALTILAEGAARRVHAEPGSAEGVQSGNAFRPGPGFVGSFVHAQRAPYRRELRQPREPGLHAGRRRGSQRRCRQQDVRHADRGTAVPPLSKEGTLPLHASSRKRRQA